MHSKTAAAATTFVVTQSQTKAVHKQYLYMYTRMTEKS